MGSLRSPIGAARRLWLLLPCLGLGAARDGSSSRDSSTAADEVMLLQASTQRHVEPPTATLANGTLFDADGCPVTDPSLAYFGNCSSAISSSTWRHSRHCDPDFDEKMRADEKEVYFMRHAMPDCCLDCGLDSEGRLQVEGLKEHNRLLLEGGPVQVVYMSPATRAMETGLRMFAGSGARFQLDTRIVENIPFSHCDSCGEEVIRLNAKSESESLHKQYRDIFGPPELTDNMRPWTAWHHQPEERAKDFTKFLLSQPEKRVAVVSHFHFLSSFGEPLSMGCMEMGQVVVKGALSKEGEWRRVSEASCQGRRRRWKYGNYRRQVPVVEEPEGDEQ